MAGQGKKEKKSRPSTLRLLLNNQLATAGLILFSLIVLIALLAPVLPTRRQLRGRGRRKRSSVQSGQVSNEVSRAGQDWRLLGDRF